MPRSGRVRTIPVVGWVIGAAVLVMAALGVPGPATALSAAAVGTQELAFATECVEARTVFSRESVLEDGRRVVEVFADPIHYPDAQGALQPIDTTLTACPDAAFPYQNTTNLLHSRFGTLGCDQPAVRVEQGAYAVSFGLVGEGEEKLTPASGQVDGSRLSYRGVLPGVDFIYTVGAGALKEEIVLASPQAPASFAFALTLEGLTALAQEDGSILLIDGEGEPQLRLERPFMVDSSVPAARSEAVTQELVSDGERLLVRLRADAEWLADPARIYPVTIDPTIVVQGASDDSYVDPSHPTTNYGTSTILKVSADQSGGRCRGLVKFSLPTLCDYPQIESATLGLRVALCDEEMTISAHAATQSWSQSTVTWNTKPTQQATPDDAVVVPEGGGGEGGGDAWASFDVTSRVRGWYEGSATNYGHALLGSTSSGDGTDECWFTSSNVSTASDRPKLTIVYAAGDPRHTTYSLGSFADHTLETALDRGRLQVAVTDLACASFGPPAVLDRYYSSSTTTAGAFAYGWRFGFDRKLSFVSGTRTDYIDARGEVHTFFLVGSTWVAPSGLVANLAHPSANWTLTCKDRSVLTFDSSGKLLAEADRNGNTVTYAWSTYAITITAANGQQIVVTRNASGKVTAASYATAAGTRQVTYSTAAPFQVTYFPSTALAHTVKYTYTSNVLTELRALAFSAAAGDAWETFAYTSGKLSEVRFPDYASSIPAYNAANTDARLTIAYATNSATLTARGCVRTAGTPTGATGQTIAQTYTWNPTGTLATRTNPGAASQVWSYAWTEGSNWFCAETSPLGETREWTYDARGNVTAAYDALDHATLYTYPTSDSDPNRDLPQSVTDPRGAVATYSYDTASNLLQVVRDLTTTPTAEKARTTYTYGDVTVGSATFHAALTQESSLVGGSTWATTDYDSDVYYPNGQPQKTVFRDVDLYDPAYPPPSPPTSPVDVTITRTYDALGNLLTETDTAGQLTATSTYDLAGHLLTRTGAPFPATVGGSSTSTQTVQHYTYDAWGHETESWQTSTQEAAQTAYERSTRTYDDSGRISVETNYLAGQVQSTVTHRYDGRGLEITTQDSTISGQPALSAYSAAGEVVASWQAGVADYADAKATRYLLPDGTPAYDAAGRQLRTIAAGDSAPAITTYTICGQTLRDSAADGTWTQYGYDEAGNATDEERSDGGAVSRSFDLGGRVIATTDENNQVTAATYDCLGRAVSTSAGGAAASTTTYNTLGWVLSTQDADGMATRSVYGTSGRAVSTSAAGNTTSFIYDAAGHTLQEIDPNDRWVQYEYDWAGRTSRELHTLPGSPRSTARDTSTLYDTLGRTADVTDNLLEITHHTSYPLNTPGNVTETLVVGDTGTDAVATEIVVGATTLETSRTTQIDANPQVADLVRTITTRDAGMRVTAVTLDMGQASDPLSQYLYDTAGRLMRQWGSNGGGSGYTSSAESSNAYSYDAQSGHKTADNLQLSSVGTAGPIIASYSYTDDGRLDAATVDGVSEDDTFDVAGNLISYTSGAIQTTLTYDAASRLQTTLTGATTYFAYDASHGWRTSEGLSTDQQDPNRLRYTYTGSGRLATYQNPVADVQATYEYDAAGQRTLSSVTVDATTTTTAYVYEGLQLLRLTAQEGGPAGSASWQLTYLYDEAGRPYAGIYREPADGTSPRVFGIITSDRGDVLALLDAAGDPFAAYRYDAWGNPQGAGNVACGIWTQATAIINASQAAAIACRQPLRYAGYCYDAESHTYYLSARTYDPRTRQFLQKDPADADGEESAYQYCGGNPVEATDESGQDPKWIPDPKAIDWSKASSDDRYLLRVLKRNGGVLYEVVYRRFYFNKERALVWWYNQVKAGSSWDFKVSVTGHRDPTYRHLKLYGYRPISKEEFGNIHFGYTGAVLGLFEVTMWAGSLWAHLTDNGLKGVSASHLANEFRDWGMIRRGIQLFRTYYKPEYTGVWFVR